MAPESSTGSVPSHERQAVRAEELRVTTEQRYQNAVRRQDRAESLARGAKTQAERDRQCQVASVHHKAALCHRRAAELFALHRDHEREHVEWMNDHGAAR